MNNRNGCSQKNSLSCLESCSLNWRHFERNFSHLRANVIIQKHLPEDERSFSRNVASLKNMIQDKTNCSFESIQHTESTNLNIFRIEMVLAQGLTLG